MGVLAVILYVPVLLWLKDLSPSLRMMVMDSETMGAAYESGEAAPETPAPEVTGSARHAFSHLPSRWGKACIALPVTSGAGVSGAASPASYAAPIGSLSITTMRRPGDRSLDHIHAGTSSM